MSIILLSLRLAIFIIIIFHRTALYVLAALAPSLNRASAASIYNTNTTYIISSFRFTFLFL